jgi:ribosomal protein S26
MSAIFPNYRVIHLRVHLHVRCFGTFGIVRVLTRERQKSSVEVRKLFGRFRKEFQSNRELNNKVIDIN